MFPMDLTVCRIERYTPVWLVIVILNKSFIEYILHDLDLPVGGA